MKKSLKTFQLFTALILVSFISLQTNAQMQWRLVNLTFSAVDPDGAGPAKGSATFKLQIHKTTAGTISNVNTISTGWSYQSSKAMVPTGTGLGPGCPSAAGNNPANVTVSPRFSTAGFTYQTVNQCGTASQTPNGAGGEAFDRRVVGTLDGGIINLTDTWDDVFTVTLWSLNPVNTTDAGFVMINSGSGGTPGAFGSYAVADDQANEYTVNSLTYSALVALPVALSKFDVTCNTYGVKLNWQTSSEQNTSSFEIEKSKNGVSDWTTIGSSKAAGNSTTPKQYEYVDLSGGSAFYRLRQVDKDGKFTYSGVLKVNCQSKQTDLFVYPVPAKDVMNVVINTEKTSKAAIMLVDVTGRLVRQIQTDLQTGSNNIKLNVSGLGSGEYFIKVIGTEISKTQKVTIIN